MIIGVGEYLNSGIPDLPGPPEDAQRFYDLLINNFDFPVENVCMLLNADATVGNVKSLFVRALTERAKAEDEVVFFFAGHGSQVPDQDGDEQDGMDETFVLHDSRTGSGENFVSDLIDDDFYDLLIDLSKKTQQITLFIDSCNAGTIMRGDTDYLTRYIPPPQENNKIERLASKVSTVTSGEAGHILNLIPDGVVVFTAAADGTSALERNARGIFSDAILEVLGQANAGKLTYAQAARQIRPLVKAESNQMPYFQGNLQRDIFSGINRNRPVGWEVIETEPEIKLGGFPLPGVGKGAEFRIYDGSIQGKDTRDPAKAKAVVLLEESTGLNGTAKIISHPLEADPVRPGDLAVLARSGDDQRLLRVTLRPENKYGGLDANRAQKIQHTLMKHADAQKVVALVTEKGDFEVSLDEDNQYVVRGPENDIRNRFSKESSVIENLWQFSLQRVFGSLRGEVGGYFTDQETIQVRIIPSKRQKNCPQWQQASSNDIVSQDIPLGCLWNIEVRLSEHSPVNLLVGGLVLSTDGTIIGIPQDNSAMPLKPGEALVFPETFKASEPLHIEDQIIIFGTYEDNPVPWAMLTQQSVTRSIGKKSGLYQALDQYMTGTRGLSLIVTEPEDTNTAWTMSSITMRVNSGAKMYQIAR